MRASVRKVIWRYSKRKYAATELKRKKETKGWNINEKRGERTGTRGKLNNTEEAGLRECLVYTTTTWGTTWRRAAEKRARKKSAFSRMAGFKCVAFNSRAENQLFTRKKRSLSFESSFFTLRDRSIYPSIVSQLGESSKKRFLNITKRLQSIPCLSKDKTLLCLIIAVK